MPKSQSISVLLNQQRYKGTSEFLGVIFQTQDTTFFLLFMNFLLKKFSDLKNTAIISIPSNFQQMFHTGIFRRTLHNLLLGVKLTLQSCYICPVLHSQTRVLELFLFRIFWLPMKVTILTVTDTAMEPHIFAKWNVILAIRWWSCFIFNLFPFHQTFNIVLLIRPKVTYLLLFLVTLPLRSGSSPTNAHVPLFLYAH